MCHSILQPWGLEDGGGGRWGAGRGRRGGEGGGGGVVPCCDCLALLNSFILVEKMHFSMFRQPFWIGVFDRLRRRTDRETDGGRDRDRQKTSL